MRFNRLPVLLDKMEVGWSLAVEDKGDTNMQKTEYNLKIQESLKINEEELTPFGYETKRVVRISNP